MRLKRFVILLFVALLVIPVGQAQSSHDDDKDPSIRPGIRRLHPERERAKAIKKLQEQMSRRADPNADPWDTSDEVWGTVDLPPVTLKDSAAVEGRRLSSDAGDSQASRRLTWRDEPVVATLDQLMPFMTVDEGELRSRYVSGDSLANEVYFAFSLGDDSIPEALRLCIRYYGDIPIDFDQVVFTIDDYDYTFYPLAPRHGASDGHFWAASDDELPPTYRNLVYALTHGHRAMMKLQSSGGVSRIKMLNEDQLDDFANTFDLFRLLGGDF